MPNLVRCSSCAEVVAAAETCSACGAPLRSMPAPPTGDSGSYREKYRGTEFDGGQIVPVASLAARQRSKLLVGIGIGVIVAATFLGTMLFMSPSGPPPTPAPMVVAASPSPTPLPSVPAAVADAFAILTDDNLSARVRVQTHYDVNIKNAPPVASIVVLDATLSGGNAQGTYTNGTPLQFRLVDGVLYGKRSTDKSWTRNYPNGSVLHLLPLLSIHEPRDLQLVGEETLSGQQVYHLRNSKQWNPNPVRVGLLLAQLPVVPDTETLDVWVALDGSPMVAKYAATRLSPDGDPLLGIATTYEFTDVGVPVEIKAP